MPSSLPSQSSRLKRPRSNSQSTSPSSSSPKRAASESEDPTELKTGFLGHNMDVTNGNTLPGSPLRETEGGNGGELVQRTDDVHLNEVEDQGNEKYKQLYNDVLGAIPPPFKPYHTYYIIPRKFEADLKALALGDTEIKTEDTPTELQLHVKELVESTHGNFTTIQTREDDDGKRHLTPLGTRGDFYEIPNGLSEDEDFLFVHEKGWKKIMACLGDYTGPSLPRFCLPTGTIQMKPPVFSLYVVVPASDEQSSTQPISKLEPPKFTCPTTTPLSTFLALIRRLATQALGNGYDTPIMRYWQLDLTNPPTADDTREATKITLLSHDLLPTLEGTLIPDGKSSTSKTIDEIGLGGGDGIVVEIGKMGPFEKEIWAVDINKYGKAVKKAPAMMPPVPSAPPPLFSNPAMFGAVDQSGGKSPERMSTRSQSRQPEKRGRGLVGLQNLGNTCFMNSAVQCLSNTRELSEYFLSGVYTEELNYENPLGNQGLIAKAFGMTIENLWTMVNQSFSPRVLKGQVSRFASQFAGYGQHDTQELLAFLLDGLHEDLNRIIKKPYIEKPDWKAGGGDRQLAELGKECWDGYKKRNDSVIVDLFQGQLQSTLVCPECSKESITLDPFMYLTVPLPIIQTRIFKLSFVPRDPLQAPVKVKLLIPQNASFQKIKERIGSLLKVNASHLVSFDLWHGNIYSWFFDSDHNSECKENDDAVFYDLGVPTTTSKRVVGTVATDGSVTVPVFTYRTAESHRHSNQDCALQPFFITLSKTEATDSTAVREAIMKGYGRFVKESHQADLFVSSSSSHAAVPPPVDEEDEVTDIHVDEPSPEAAPPSTEIDSQSTIQSQPHLSPVLLQRKAGSSTSLSSMTSTRSHKPTKLVPRGDLFKVHVADASAGQEKGGLGGMFKSKDNTVQPLFKGSLSDASKVFSPLENRLKIKKGMFNRLTSGFGSMMSSSSSASVNDSEEVDSAPATPNSPQPVIRPGEAIFVEWSSKRYNEYFDRDLDQETIEDPAIAAENNKRREGRVIGIEDCLDEFSKEETLGQDDLWYCPVCKKHQAATKKLEIYKAPDILVICIKRFGSSRRLSDKLDNLVNFPVEGLDLEERVGERRIAKSLDLSDEECRKYDIEPSSEPLVYDLYAVDNHFGGLGGGHYTAFCKNKFDDKWYNYDDSRVSEATEKSIQSRAAYLLFYRRRAVRPIGGKSREKAEQASRAVSPELQSSSSSSNSPPTYESNRLVLREQAPETESSPPTYSSLPSPPTDSSSDLELDTGRMKDQSDEDEVERPDLRSIGEGLGFGNTAWGSSGFTRPAEVDDDEVDGDVTTTNAESDSGDATSETEELADDEAEAKDVVEAKEVGGEDKIVVDEVEVAST